MSFQALCARLRSNDERVTSVDREYMRDFNNDQAVQLGRALLAARRRNSSGNNSNTRVKRVELCLDWLTADGDYDSLLDWIASSTSLRDVTLHFRSPNVMRRFLHAVALSRTVQTLILHGNGSGIIFVESLAELLRETTSLVTLKIFGTDISSLGGASGDGGRSRDSSATKLLCAAVGDNRTITELVTSWQGPFKIGAVAKALTAENSAVQRWENVQPLNCACCLILARCLPRMAALQCLSVKLQMCTADARYALLDGLQQNSSLVRTDVRAAFWNQSNLKQLTLYAERNRRMPKLSVVPVCQLPRVCATALACTQGPAWVYTILSEAGDELPGTAQ
jgi:hypothetical protein